MEEEEEMNWGSDFCSQEYRIEEEEEVDWAEGREGAEVESDKWTGFNLRPINILVLSPRAACLVRVCLPFRRFSAVFRFFSRIRYLCRARGNILARHGIRASRIFLLSYDP